MVSVEPDFYDTTYKRSYSLKPGHNAFSPHVPPIPEVDPNLIPGYFANNLIINDSLIESKTWKKPDIPEITPEDYKKFLEKVKNSNSFLYERYFTNPDVSIPTLESTAKDLKLTTYQAAYNPDEYVSRKEGLKWPRSKLDTSDYSYQEKTYGTYYNRINEVKDFRKLAKPFIQNIDTETVKKELRKIYKTKKSSYYKHYCLPRIPKLEQLHKEGKLWEEPLDEFTHRRV